MNRKISLLLLLLTLAESTQAMNPEEWNQEGWNMEEADMFPLPPEVQEQIMEANEIFLVQQRQRERMHEAQPNEAAIEEAQTEEVQEPQGQYARYRFGRPITFRDYYYGNEEFGIESYKPFADVEVRHGHMLQLSGLGLTSLDGIEEVPNIQNLRSLLLSNNLFDAIPPIIGTLTPNLQRLYMGQNRVAEIPAFIFEMSHLEWLELNNNRLTTLPVSLDRLTALQRLSLEGNMININMNTEVPDFDAVRYLHQFYIYNNPIPLGEQELRKKLNLRPFANLFFKSWKQEQAEFEFLQAIKSGDETTFRARLREILRQPLVVTGYDVMGDSIYGRIDIAKIRDVDGNNILHAIVGALSKKLQEITNSPELSDETRQKEIASAEITYTKFFLILFELDIPQMQQMLLAPNAHGLNVIAAAIGAEGIGAHSFFVKTLLDYAYAVQPRVTAQETARILQRIEKEKQSKVKEEKEGKETMAEKEAREQKEQEDRQWKEIKERENQRRLEKKRARELREEEGL